MRLKHWVLPVICLLQIGCQNSSSPQPPPPVEVKPATARPADRAPAAPMQSRPRFALYKTDNMFTLLLLDTKTGRVWQAQYAVDERSFRGAIPVSSEILSAGPNGRFTLTKTENMWTFILTDTKNGRLWQCQFSVKSDQDRLCVPIDLTSKEIGGDGGELSPSGEATVPESKTSADESAKQ
jgi:hypothetical protein